ncbi:unnamed protein product [Penicillium roqueforti FM164]|uniref:Genomic scaffold, ProqFM164S02 n=1 Tax=Penicillium roqueforti (strain FM164) TaxID=1365484 RepID=W6Q3X0_PENRF|nr:unnamed protein product [Penicillium roqueforti FM164]
MVDQPHGSFTPRVVFSLNATMHGPTSGSMPGPPRLPNISLSALLEMPGPPSPPPSRPTLLSFTPLVPLAL